MLCCATGSQVNSFAVRDWPLTYAVCTHMLGGGVTQQDDGPMSARMSETKSKVPSATGL